MTVSAKKVRMVRRVMQVTSCSVELRPQVQGFLAILHILFVTQRQTLLVFLQDRTVQAFMKDLCAQIPTELKWSAQRKTESNACMNVFFGMACGKKGSASATPDVAMKDKPPTSPI